MDASETHKNVQIIVVMRHGARADQFKPLCVSTAATPWDPHPIGEGRVRAFFTGRRLRTNLGFPIHRVFVCLFLRCIQTAYEVVSALCTVDDDPNAMSSKDVSLDPSKIKFELCEVLDKEAIRNKVAPKDGNLGFNASELEALCLLGQLIVLWNECASRKLYLLQCEETLSGERERYKLIKALADKCPSENLLLVTHGEVVGLAVSSFFKDVTVYEVDYCAYTELRRPIFIKK